VRAKACSTFPQVTTLPPGVGSARVGEHDDLELELQTVERQLEAVERRLAEPGHAEKTPAAVLDDERATQRALSAERDRLRERLASRKTPIAGTVRANAGVWQPLSLHERIHAPEDDLPAFATETHEPRRLETLERELATIFTDALAHDQFGSLYLRLKKVTDSWASHRPARRLLGAAFRSLYRLTAADFLHPESPLVLCEPRALHSPLLDGATEFPDEVSGLTATETSVLRALAVCTPANGPFVRTSEVLREWAPADALDEAKLLRALGSMGHPSLRRLPLVEYQGFQGRFDPAGPTFTHVRPTQVGRQVLDGSLAVPLLLVNGAAGPGTFVPSYRPADLLAAARHLLWSRGLDWPAFRELCARADFPDGTQVRHAETQEFWRRGWAEMAARAAVDVEIDAAACTARLVVHRFPWPLRAREFVQEVEAQVRLGQLDGVRSVRDDSAADTNRLVIELEHVVFALPLQRRLQVSRRFEAKFKADLCIAGEVPGSRRTVDVVDLLRAFIESRVRNVMRGLEGRVHTARERALGFEAVCVALLAKESVLSALRSAISDEEAIELVQRCLRPEDVQTLGSLPHPPASDYTSGFTRSQAEFLVKQRKLASRSMDTARGDWLHALAAVEEARSLALDRHSVLELVEKELQEAGQRFADERRSTAF